MYVKEVGSEGMDWIYLAKDKLQLRNIVSTVIHHQFS
jgi:hypothetical protein